MNVVYSLIALRGLALLALLTGKSNLSGTLYDIADLTEAGRATDEHLTLISEKLKARSLVEADWQQVHDRIATDRALLHAPAAQAGRARLPMLLALLLVGAAGIALAASPAVRQATLSWTVPTLYSDGTAIGAEDLPTLRYNVYRGAKGTSPAAKTRIAESLDGLLYVDTVRPPGVEECYQVTALFNGQPLTEGGPSAEGCKSHPRPAAGTPTLTVE